MTKQELYIKLTSIVKSSATQRGFSFNVNVFNDNTAIVQVNVSINNMRASVLACVKENENGTWSISDNNQTITVDSVNQAGSAIVKMVGKIRTLRSRLTP